MDKEDSKIYLSFLSFIIIIILLLIIKQFIPKNITDNISNIKLTLTPKNKINCSTSKSYCFTDDDCIGTCINDNLYLCMNGVCKNNNIKEDQIKNNCDGKKGVLAFLIGDTMLGVYNKICKSIDLGIANDDGTNNMCKNGDIDINYYEKFPTADMCNCGDKKKLIKLPQIKTHRQIGDCVDNDMYNFLTFSI